MNSLLITGKYSIEVRNGKFFFSDTEYKCSDIYLLRLRLIDFTDSADYIMTLSQQFRNALIVAEIGLNSKCVENIEFIGNNFKSLAILLRIPLIHGDNNDSWLCSDDVRLLDDIKAKNCTHRLDRVVIVDEDAVLYPVIGEKLKNTVVNALGLSPSSLGFCVSPLSVEKENSCLSAKIATNLYAKYKPESDFSFQTCSKGAGNCSCVPYGLVDKSISFKRTTIQATGGKSQKSKKKAIPLFINW